MQAVAMVKERPILFSPAMIRAILGGNKTQTRRVAKLANQIAANHSGVRVRREKDGTFTMSRAAMYTPAVREPFILECPYGLPGDVLYVKEGSWIWCKKRPDGTTAKGRPEFRYVPVGRHVIYRADGVKPTEQIDADPSHQWRLKVARFMPKWASRLTLEVVSVRVERVQEISEADAIAEGVCLPERAHTFAWADGPLRNEFAYLWESINGACEGCAWADNPWVWCIEFRKVAA